MPPIVYQVRVKEHLPPAWAGEFSGMDLKCEPEGFTSLTGPLPDQAALHGLLARIRDLGLTLVSINPIHLEGKEDHEPIA